MIKQLLKYTCVIIALLVGNGVSAQTGSANAGNLPAAFKLSPVPQKVELNSAGSLAPSTLNAVSLEGTTVVPPVQLFEKFKKTSAADRGVVILKISTAIDNEEGYVLDIAKDRVTITAKSDAGLFYGSQTLSQLMQDAREQKVNIPAARITDYPEIQYRAVHLDLKHHLDSLSYYYKLMDRLAAIKVNAVMIEFEDKLKFRGAPKVGSSNAIPVEQFAKLSDYAKKRNIEISPLVQGLGHASFILKHPEYKALRDDSTSDWSFDPLNPETYKVQFSLYDDALAATPHGKYLHVGGDEVGKLGMSERAKKSGMKPIELQMAWLKKVCEYAEQHDRIPVFWDDMVFKLSGLYETTYDASIPKEEVEKRWKENEKLLNENIHLFPKNCLYMRWNYDNPTLPGNQKAIEWYSKNNLNAIAATAGQQIWPLLPRASSNFQPIKDFAKLTADGKLNGILLTLWDDASPHFETYWRGIHDFALFTWNYEDIEKDKAHARFRHRFYGPALSDQRFAFQDTLEKAVEFWQTALIEKGYRENYPEKIDTLALPDSNSPGSWSARNKQKLEAAREAINRHRKIKQTLQSALNAASRNKYALEIFNQINELHIYPAELLLKLEKYDLAKNAQQKRKAAQEVRAFANGFSKLRSKYERVFGRTRILNNPQDYLLDQNHHKHLANGTRNSDWMYVYELALNEKIRNEMTD